MDTYDLLSCVTEQYQHHTTFEVLPADPMVYAAILQHGLNVNDTTYNPITPTPPKLQTYKVNFRRIPQHYKRSDIIQLFSKYGNPMEIGMYYYAHPKRKVFTQDGYVLFEKDGKPSHPELPKEIAVGPGHPIITNIVGAPKSNDKASKTTQSKSTSPRPNNNKEPNSVSPAKDVKEQDAEGFTQQRKRNGKKRIKRAQVSSSMEGVESTSPGATDAPVVPDTPAVPATDVAPVTLATSTPQESIQVVRPPRTNNTIQGQYRSPDNDSSDSSDSDDDVFSDAPPLTTEATGRHPRAAQFGGTYNTKELSRQSATRAN